MRRIDIAHGSPADVITGADVDMMSPSADGRFLHKDGTPYPAPGA